MFSRTTLLISDTLLCRYNKYWYMSCSHVETSLNIEREVLIAEFSLCTVYFGCHHHMDWQHSGGVAPPKTWNQACRRPKTWEIAAAVGAAVSLSSVAAPVGAAAVSSLVVAAPVGAAPVSSLFVAAPVGAGAASLSSAPAPVGAAAVSSLVGDAPVGAVAASSLFVAPVDASTVSLTSVAAPVGAAAVP